MQTFEIYKKFLDTNIPSDIIQYSLFSVKIFNTEVYFGKNIDGNMVYVIESAAPQIQPSCQKTKKLAFLFNARCTIRVNGIEAEKIMHAMTCISSNEEDLYAFIRLSTAFTDGLNYQNPKKIHDLFISLTNLFATERKANDIELQGFYAELFTIDYFYYKYGAALNNYWQKKNKLKFDFSISDKKRIEIKSTTRENRIHHFRHEQLLSDLYDIRVISYLLRHDDSGYSLYDLIESVRSIASSDYETILYIEEFIKNVEIDKLRSIKYDTIHLENQMRIFDAANIPRFQIGQPQGVSHTEYDSDLSNTKSEDIARILNWIKE